MFGTIVVPTDGSVVSNSVLPTARTLARSTGAEIVLVRVLPAALARGASALADEARYDLERVRTELTTPELRVSCYLRFGEPAAQIVETAANLRAGLIAMATFGLTGFDRLMAGSVCDDVLRRGQTPVLLSRWSSRQMRHLHRILVPTDRSPGAALALSVALPLARSSGASVTLLQVGKDVRDSAYSAQNDVRHTAKQLVDKGYQAAGVAFAGDPATSIVERADELDADVLVMSTHALTGAARAVLGSVADAVVHRANCPVILVHWRDWVGPGEQHSRRLSSVTGRGDP